MQIVAKEEDSLIAEIKIVMSPVKFLSDVSSALE
jgi:hypothetical protein